MRLISAVLLAAIVVTSPALASEPGQPLDCSDWVFLDPGVSCTAVRPIPCGGLFCSGSDDSPPGNPRAVDPAGNIFAVRRAFQLDDCGTGGLHRKRTQILRLDTAGAEHVVAYIEDRCNVGGPYLEYLAPSNPSIAASSLWLAYEGFVHLLPSDGRLIVALRSECISINDSCPPLYDGGVWLAAFDGFTTTFEILQTYTPTANEISFRVPYMPEGFQYADYFDTYYGDIGNYDFTAAQPLQCGYPTPMPSVGDYLTVADTLPTPAAGEGRWYLTAVTYQGETRYGRKAMGGELSGRPPALLPLCDR